MKQLFLLCLLIGSLQASGQVHISVDTSNARIRQAALFLTGYLAEFSGGRQPDYARYWSREDCLPGKIPDDMAFSISTDGATYSFSSTPTLFYARPYPDYIHLKTLFAYTDTTGLVMPWAITNHYVFTDSSGRPFFKSEMTHHARSYVHQRVDKITYHMPAGYKLDMPVAQKLLQQIRKLEQEWGWQPLEIDYYFARTNEEVMHLRGLDYAFGMDETSPGGMSYPDTRTLFCYGMGEGYLHEVLHLYLNPQYGKSPFCHGLIYYLAGGLGHDFSWMVQRLRDYLVRYPETSLTHFEELETKDKMLHIDHVVTGLLCREVYKQQGVKGLKKLLSYQRTDDALMAMFHLPRQQLDAHIRTLLR